MSAQSCKTLGAIVYPDFELLDLYGPLEMFGSLGDACKIITVSDQPGLVPSSQGPQTHAEYAYEECPPLDLVLLPGGWGTPAQLDNVGLIDFLKQRSASAEYTMSVCSGSAILARAGLLDGRRATSNKQLFQLATMQSDKVDWVEQARWVVDGRWVTASGVSAGIDMALAVIAMLYDEDRAQSIADMTEYQWHRDGHIDPFVRFLNAIDLSALSGQS